MEWIKWVALFMMVTVYSFIIYNILKDIKNEVQQIDIQYHDINDDYLFDHDDAFEGNN